MEIVQLGRGETTIAKRTKQKMIGTSEYKPFNQLEDTSDMTKAMKEN